MLKSGRFRIIALAVGVCCLALPATLLTASASTPDVNGYGVFELDGNACKDAATTPPFDWGNQTGGNTCSGTDASPAIGLFSSDYSQAVAPGATTGGKTMVNDIMCSDAGSTPTCPQANGDLAFVTGGSKDGQNPNGNWTCTDKPVTPKDEIDNAGGAVFTAPSTSTTTLSGAQSVSGSTTSLTVGALTQPFDFGDTITIGSGGSQQTATVSSTAAVGATTISITGVTPIAATSWASGTTVTDTATHAILYMDIERGITTGTSNAAFWLFQKPVRCSVPTGSHSATFTGGHTNGDVLVFATFNSGGAICSNGASSTACIQAFAWSGGASGSLGATAQLTGTACINSVTSTCGAVNSANVTTPWAPHNTAATAIPANGFFEAGVDLTDFFGSLPGNGTVNGQPILGLPVPCLSTYLADTRSSGTQGNAVNSDLHDYISGSFTNCKATIQTTPQHSSITLGSSITDTAVVSGAAGFPAPTGSVSFWVCGPLATAPTTAGPNCTTSGTPVNNTAIPPSNSVNLSGSPPTATSASFTPTATGTYCFLGVYSGDTNYAGVSDSSGRECFAVTNTSLKTTPSKTLVFLGQSVTDSGALTFTPAPTASNGLSAAGTLAFSVCGPLASTTTAGPNCTAAAGTAEGSATVSSLGAVSGGSNSFTPGSTGTYCFLGVYTPAAGSNYPSASDSSSGECFVVTTSSLTTTPSTTAITLGASVTDSGALTFTPAPTASNGLNANGTLNFYVCGPLASATQAGPNCSSSTGTAEGSATVGSDGTVTGHSNAFTPTAAGTYCFLGVYTPGTGATYPSASDSSGPTPPATSGGECFTAAAAPAPLASTVRLDDVVSLPKNSTAGTPSGAVTFNIYGPFTAAPTSCSGTTLRTVTIQASSEAYDASGNGYWAAAIDVPATITGTAGGNVWYAWSASFDPLATGGNHNYASGSLGCTNEVVELTYGAGDGFTIPTTTPSLAD